MATNIIITVKGGEAEAWQAQNPLLKNREIGYDKTNRRFKVGDGETLWNDLPYVKPDVINDLVTGGADAALSAEQGVVLKEQIEELRTQIENGDFEGAAATIDIGTVNQVKSSEPAAVRNVGTRTNAILEFDIPKGAAGTSGSTPNIQVQPRVNICDNPADAKVERTGSITTPILEFTLPRGAKGEDGDGKAATINIGTVTTGAAGSNASVTNVGTENAAILNFTIPRGATGAKGDKGDKGDTGATGATPTIKVGTVTTGAAGSSASVTSSTSGTTTTFNFTIPRGNTGAAGTSGYSTENWTFTLDSGGTVTKRVVLN